MSLEGNVWGDKFGNKGSAAFAAFMSTYNMVSQQLTGDTDFSTVALQDCTINGVYIPILPASGAVTWAGGAEIVGDAEGVVVPADYSIYLAIFANASGELRVDLAGIQFALDADVALKMPWFDPTVWCCIGISLIDGNATTLASDDLSGVDTISQVIGPVLPHPDNLTI